MSQATEQSVFFFNDTATTEIYTLSLHDALPIYITRDDLASGGECRRPGIIPDRAGIGESGDFDARILGHKIKRGLHLEARTPIIATAEGIPENAGERQLRQIAWSNSGWRKAAHQIGAHLEVVEHAQASAAQACHLPALQMQETNDVGEHLAIMIEGTGRAKKPHVAAHAGKILPELRQQPRRRVLVVVERVVGKRVTDERSENRAVRHGAFHRKRGLAVRIAVADPGKSGRL